MFGHHPVESPQTEYTPFNPDNPYGSSKVFAYHLTKNYREHYGLFACSGILYNHESEWRPPRFVTRKISMAAAAIKHGKQDVLDLGALESLRRPPEGKPLCGDPSEARRELGRQPKVTFEQMIRLLVDKDLERLKP